MANIENNPPGSFCWVELATTDQSAAKNFYGSLLGWSVADMPMGPGDFYSIFKLEGRDTGAAYTLRKDQRERGVPPHWMVYVAVESADKAAAKADELGGKILAPAFDVFDAGRMAVLQDPTGAIFCVWQAKKNKGIGIGGVEGTFCWADLSTPNPESAGKFYSGLFGWKIAPGEHDTSGYLHIKNGEHFIGGVPPAKHYNPQMPPHWLIYFYVSDVDATAAKASKAGAKLYLPPMTIENVGRMSVIADPQGAAFSIFKSARQ
jgi:predicted enzyme related to lactoylglutathione lyase